MEARTYSLLDNCKGHLDSAQLEAFASSIRWKGRVLGMSKSFCGENNVTVFITAVVCVGNKAPIANVVARFIRTKKTGRMCRLKYWEFIADNLSKGFQLGLFI